jgi:DUF4097 and DUF4098 domain-containing protein YvlB
MNTTLSVRSKLSILILFALIFAATMIALSVRNPESPSEDAHFWGKTKTIEKKFSVHSGENLALDADVGNISITGNDSQELSIVVTAKGSDEILSKYHVDFDQEGGTVRVRGKHDRKYFHFFDNVSMEILFEIQLPKSFNLNLQTSGGDITVHNIDGTIKGETSGGDIEIDKLTGIVKLTTSGGNIALTNSNGDLTLETSGGDIRGESLTGTVNVETSGGNIAFLDTDGKLNASTSGGDIKVELKDNKGINLSTSGGNISIRLPKSISGQVLATTTGGDVSCDFPFSGRLKEGSLKGTINGGGNLIQAETSGGDIVISSVE